jgi:hypothetical protein
MISWSELFGMTEIWIESYIIEMVFTYLCHNTIISTCSVHVCICAQELFINGHYIKNIVYYILVMNSELKLSLD